MRTEKKMKIGIGQTGVSSMIERYEIVKHDPLYREFFAAKPDRSGPPLLSPHKVAA